MADFLTRLNSGGVYRRVLTFSKDPLLNRVSNHLKSKKMKVVGFHEFPSGTAGGEVLFLPSASIPIFSAEELEELSKLLKRPHQVLRLNNQEEFKFACFLLAHHNSKPVAILRLY